MDAVSSLPASVVAKTPQEVVIRRVHTIDEYRQCEALQVRVWGRDDIVGVPTLDLLTAQENGGIVIGAFVNDAKLVGFVYSFLGLTREGRLKQCSVLLGVDLEFQKSGLGYHLKHAQREAALAMGIDNITWTFDPLLSLNAHLNIYKLGAVTSTYLVNVYGTGHGLNAGLDTDRLLVEWWLQRVPDHDWTRLEHSALFNFPAVNEVTLHPKFGLPVIQKFDLGRTEETLLLEIPHDIQRIKAVDVDLARDWRVVTRQLFQHYLSQGYHVSGYRCVKGDVGPRPYYILHRGDIQ